MLIQDAFKPVLPVTTKDFQAQQPSTSPGLFKEAEHSSETPPIDAKHSISNTIIVRKPLEAALATLHMPDMSEVHANLKRYTNTELVYPDYLDTIQKGVITESARSQLLVWLHDMGEYFKFSSQTYSLTCTLLDQFLSKVKVQPKHMQVVGVAIFLLATKLVEDDEEQPSLYELSANSGFIFTEGDIRRMEVSILTKLNWELKTVTPLMVLEELYAFTLLTPGRPDSVCMPSFLQNCVTTLAACSLLYELLSFRGSTLALCVFAIALEEQTEAAFSGPLVAALCASVGVHDAELRACRKSCAVLFRNLTASRAI